MKREFHVRFCERLGLKCPCLLDLQLSPNPDLLITNHDLDVISSLWFFQTKILNRLAINANTKVKDVSYLVNGGNNGLNQRIKTFNVAKDNLNCPK
jgi:predicted chitinase